MIRKKRIMAILTGLMIGYASNCLAMTPYLYAGLTNEIGSGGIGFLITDDLAVDLALYHETDNTSDTTNKYYFGDIFWGNWGIGYEYDATDSTIDPLQTTSLLYSISQPINEKITLGITASLFENTSGGQTATKILSSVAASISIPLPFKI